jgi:hypothetical protein
MTRDVRGEHVWRVRADVDQAGAVVDGFDDRGRISHCTSSVAEPTRPQTLAYGLTDSPVGRLAWIIEKFKEWSTWPTATAGSAEGLGRADVHEHCS